MDSDDNLFRDFFLVVCETLCCQRVEDARPRVCVLTARRAKRQSSVQLMGTAH